MPKPVELMATVRAQRTDAPQRALDALLQISALATSSAPRDEALKGILEAVTRGLRYDRVALYLVRPGEPILEGVMSVGSSEPVAGATYDLERDECVETQVVRTGRAVMMGGREGTPTLAKADLPRNEATGREVGAVVPIWSHEKAVGAIAADRSLSGQPVTARDLEALKVFASQVGILIENRKLHEANQAKIQELLALQRISRHMTSTLDIDELLNMVVGEAIVLTGAEGGILFLLDEDGERLRLEAWAGAPPAPGRESVPVGYGIPGWVARNGRPLRVSDRGTRSEGVGYTSRKSQLAVPLLSEGRVVGVLALEGRREEAFSVTHEEILSIFAAQAAKAIEAARFFHQIRQERDLRDRILGGTPNGVVALDHARRVVLVNEAARRLLDVEEEPVGNPVERYLAEPVFLERLRRILDAEAVLESLEVTVGSGRRARHLLVSIFALGEPAGRGATLVLQDLTERRKLDERVQRMARLASIGQLAAGVAHEIRNPLTGIAISLEILGEEEGISAPGRSLLEDVNREIDRLEALIRGLLDFARPQPVEPRPMRIAKALEWHRTFDGQCRKKGIRFGLTMGRNVKLQGDPEKLKQLFLNLAINALDVTPKDGEIRVRADELTEAVGEPRRWVRVVVEDTGPGMDEETVSQIFNPFFTTKNEGTGLGLSIAHSIVDQHGGRIDVQSTPGAGTRFTVDLPALDQPEE